MSLGFAFAWATLWGLIELNRIWYPGVAWFGGPGPWPIVVAALAAPVAWFVWFVRDQNKARDIDIAQAQITQRHFERIQEWATSAQNEVLRAAAIHQLRPYVLGRAEGFISQSLAGPNSPFIEPALAILQALLDDPSLKPLPTDEPSSSREPGSPEQKPRSPVLLAIESILRDPDVSMLIGDRDHEDR